MEYYNEPQGGVEGSFYSMEKFKKIKLLVDLFHQQYMTLYSNIIVEKNHGLERKRFEEVRAIYVDFGRTILLEEGKYTVIGCMCGYPNKQRARMIRDNEVYEIKSGGEKKKQKRELNYSSFVTDVFIYDNRNIGEDRYIDLSKPYFPRRTWNTNGRIWNI